jgi:hypothetical protein
MMDKSIIIQRGAIGLIISLTLGTLHAEELPTDSTLPATKRQAETLAEMEAELKLPPVKPQARGGWLVSFGAVHRRLERARMSPGTHFTPASVPSIGHSSHHNPEARIGSADTADDRIYQDGFVRQDPGTPYDGSTWHWGYQRNEQIANETLMLQAYTGKESRFTRHELMLPGTGIDGSESGTGPFIEVAKTLHRTDTWSAGLSLSAFFVPFSARSSTSTFQVDQSLTTYTIDTTDRYNVSEIIPPAAPYAGSYEGPGPLISNTPDSRHTTRRTASQRNVSHRNVIDQSLDINHTSIALGVRADATHQRLVLSTTIGPTLNWVEINGKRTELLNETSQGVTTTMARQHDQASDDTLAIGAFVQAGAALKLTTHSQLAVHGRYDFLESLNGIIGPSQYEVDLSGYALIATWLTAL